MEGLENVWTVQKKMRNLYIGTACTHVDMTQSLREERSEEGRIEGYPSRGSTDLHRLHNSIKEQDQRNKSKYAATRFVCLICESDSR